MNSTEMAWRKFYKTEIESVPTKDVSLEGKLDTLSAQMNKIEVDSARIAAVVPELLGDEGVEESLKNEEDLPEMEAEGAEDEKGEEEVSKDGEGDGEGIALAEDGETVGNPEDPEGIFTEDPDAEKAESEEGDEPAEEGEPKAGEDPTEEVKEGELPEAEAEPSAQGEVGEDKAEAEQPPVPARAEEAEAPEAPEEAEKVEEGEDGEEVEPEPEIIIDPQTGKPVEVVPEPESEKVIATQKVARKSVRKSAFMSIYKSDCEECEDKNPAEKLMESEGATTASSAGAVNAVYGGEMDEPAEKKCCKSQFLKFGTPGHTGVWQREDKARTNSENPCYSPDPAKAKRRDWTNAQREAENASRRVSHPGDGDSYRTHGGSPSKARRRAKQRYHEENPDAKYRGKDGKLRNASQNLRSTVRNRSTRGNKVDVANMTVTHGEGQRTKHGGRDDEGKHGRKVNRERAKARSHKDAKLNSDSRYTKRKKKSEFGASSFLGLMQAQTSIRKSVEPAPVQAPVQTQPIQTQPVQAPVQKHIRTMQEAVAYQRPSVVSTGNGVMSHPHMTGFQKSVNAPIGSGASPAECTKADWADYYAMKGKY